MGNGKKNSSLANQIYMLVNGLNTAFMGYIIATSFYRFDWYQYIGVWSVSILIGMVILLNALTSYARKNGGVLNPMRAIKGARRLHQLAILFFLAGIILPRLTDIGGFRYLSILAIPIDIIGIYIAHSNAEVKDETDLIDDFEIDED